MNGANLTCFKSTCHGEFVFLGDQDGEALYKCRECGADLSQTGVEELAGDNGAVGQLARLLLEGEA